MKSTLPQQTDLVLKSIDFIAYIDQLKSVIRKNGLIDGSRKENTAEHSWHAAVSAVVLAPYANQPVDIDKVVLMLLIHDLVEIEAGDRFVYDEAEITQQEKAEEQALEQVFNHLPAPQAENLKALWGEFEARKTPEAKFAKAIDRFLPLYSNIINQGFSWLPYGISQSQVRRVCSIIQEGSSVLWDLVDKMLVDAVNEGYLLP